MMNNAARVLGILAHPDDVGCLAGGVLAHVAARGYGTYVWLASGGGSHGASAADVRTAARVLGIRGIKALPYDPDDLAQADPQDMTIQMITYIRQIQPQVLLTSAPQSAHPSHALVSQWATSAVQAAANRHTPVAHDWAPHQVARLGYLFPLDAAKAPRLPYLVQHSIDLTPYRPQVEQACTVLALSCVPPRWVVCAWAEHPADSAIPNLLTPSC